MQGYLNRPEATEEALRGGWLHTGDVGSLDERGVLTLLDRKKDVIISGGLNIYAREVEDALIEARGVADIAVIGIPDEEWGEAVVALVVAEGGTCNHHKLSSRGTGASAAELDERGERRRMSGAAWSEGASEREGCFRSA